MANGHLLWQNVAKLYEAQLNPFVVLQYWADSDSSFGTVTNITSTHFFSHDSGR